VLFNSYSFLLFFLVVLVASRALAPWRARKCFLLVASYVFYAAWNPPFVILLWFSTLLDWSVAKKLDRVERPSRRRVLLAVSLVGNLGLLGFFKYGGFLLDNFVGAANLLGWTFKPADVDIILPVGISFYTFQTISYTFDVYRRRIRRWHSFLDYALYVTFFPQLVAGPIVRARDFLPQCVEPHRATGAQLGWGLALVVMGLFEKIVVADALMAPVVEFVYDSQAAASFGAAWTGTFAFAVQIFCDFAGYSSCAIGVAMCLGFELPVNFRFPYAACGLADFWRRWHISLSSWLRDYLYVPLGGNRKGSVRTYLNIMATMLLGGLWHGAAWTFIFWGGLHGMYLVVERVLKNVIPEGRFRGARSARIVWGLLTFVLVSFTWVFFRARTFHRAFTLARAMLGNAPAGAELVIDPLRAVAVIGTTMVLLAVHWSLRGGTLEDAVRKCPWLLRAFILAGMMVAIVMMMSGEERAFIYFQF